MGNALDFVAIVDDTTFTLGRDRCTVRKLERRLCRTSMFLFTHHDDVRLDTGSFPNLD